MCRSQERGANVHFVPIHAGNPGPLTGTGNWTYLAPGTTPTLVDAGVGHEPHVAKVAALAERGVTQVLVTHAHIDHISGVAALLARWPEARFAKMPWPERDEPHGVRWSALADGARVAAGDGELEVVHTPGHAPDHIALWDADSRTLLSGDLVAVGTTVAIPASSGGSLVDYLHSLRRVLALGPRRLLPAHGPGIDDPEALIHHYLDHRHQREHQVLTALESGPRTADEIVAMIYLGIGPAVIPMARDTVLAHLVKLVQDGLVVREGERWMELG
jgi:glyoxylase-like metal-dependent hydrolase (beta-lactamase superfamily II)